MKKKEIILMLLCINVSMYASEQPNQDLKEQEKIKIWLDLRVDRLSRAWETAEHWGNEKAADRIFREIEKTQEDPAKYLRLYGEFYKDEPKDSL